MRKAILFTLVLVACLLPTSAALAVDFRITNYEMTVDIQSDGSALVSETLDYAFDASYSGILSSFDVGDLHGGITDLSLSVDGDQQLSEVDVMMKQPFTYTLRQEGNMLNVRAYAPGHSGARTFRYTYRMNGLCQRYQDAARLNYKLIGTANEVALENATIVITLPGDVIDAWAHGAMSAADIHRDGNVLTIGPKNVNPKQFAEADILFDEASLSDVQPQSQPIIESTRALEASLASSEKNRRTLTQLLAGLLLALPLGCMALVRRIGNETGFKRRLQDNSDPDALKGVRAVTAQWIHASKVDTDGLTGTILELVAAGAVTMDRPESGFDEIHFVRADRDVPGLTEAQNHVLKWLFWNDRPITSDSLYADGDLDKIRAHKRNMEQLAALAKAEAQDMGYMSGRESKIGALVGLCLLAMAAAVGAFFVAPWWAGMVALVPVFGTIALSFKLRRLSDDGERVYEALSGLAGQGMPDAPPQDVPRIAALCAALGCLTPFFEQVQQSEAWRDGAEFYPYWFYDGWTHDVDHTRNQMHQSWKANSAALLAASTSSDGGGDSGGSSSGGSSGGGGGGGGHGAW